MLKALHEMLHKKYVRKFDLDSWSKQLAESTTLGRVETLLFVLRTKMMFDVVDEESTCSICCGSQRQTKNSKKRRQDSEIVIGKPIESCSVCNATFHLDCVINQTHDNNEDSHVNLFNKSVGKRLVSIICGPCNQKRLDEMAEAEAAEARKIEVIDEALNSGRYAFRVSNLRLKRYDSNY